MRRFSGWWVAWFLALAWGLGSNIDLLGVAPVIMVGVAHVCWAVVVSRRRRNLMHRGFDVLTKTRPHDAD